MNLKCVTFFCLVALTSPLCIDAMEDKLPLAQSNQEKNSSAQAKFKSSKNSALCVIAASRTSKNNVSALNGLTSPISMQPAIPNSRIERANTISASAPPLSELTSSEPPSYESLVHPEIGTQTDIFEEIHASLPFDKRNIGTQTDPLESLQVSLPFGEKNEEYGKFLTNARESHGEETFLALINAAYKGDYKITEEILTSPLCPAVGTFPLQAAIQGGSLKTVKDIIRFFTPQEGKTILTEAIHYGHPEIFIFISKHYNFSYKLPDHHEIVEKILAYKTINENVLEHMVSQGLNCNALIKGLQSCVTRPNSNITEELIETASPLYMAIRSNNSVAVEYFLKEMGLPFTVVLICGIDRHEHDCYNFFLNAAEIPHIKDMLMRKEESIHEIQSDLEKELKQKTDHKERRKHR